MVAMTRTATTEAVVLLQRPRIIASPDCRQPPGRYHPGPAACTSRPPAWLALQDQCLSPAWVLGGTLGSGPL